jgi:hypothetical protein
MTWLAFSFEYFGYHPGILVLPVRLGASDCATNWVRRARVRKHYGARRDLSVGSIMATGILGDHHRSPTQYIQGQRRSRTRGSDCISAFPNAKPEVTSPKLCGAGFHLPLLPVGANRAKGLNVSQVWRIPPGLIVRLQSGWITTEWKIQGFLASAAEARLCLNQLARVCPDPRPYTASCVE